MIIIIIIIIIIKIKEFIQIKDIVKQNKIIEFS